MAEVNLIPELRFPEFDKDWKLKKLGNDFDMKSGNFIPAKEIEDEPNPHLFPCYGGNGLRGYTKSYTHEGRYNLIGRQGALCGNVNLVSGKFHATEHAVVVDNNDNYDIYFLYFILYNLKLNRLATGQAQPGLSISILNSVKFYSPSLLEQQKIASFLTAIDERIQLLQKKKAKLEEYKKGVMQKLFSQQIRFKDENGNDFPDWEEKRLGEIGEIITGKTPSTTKKELWNGNIDFITPTDIIEENKYQKVVARTVRETDKMRILSEGTIVYTCIASIGKMAITTKPSITNQQINSLIVNDDYLNEFVYYALLKITPKIKATQANTTLPIINKTEFSKFKLFFPCIKEQIKIASFLTSLDASIESLVKEIEGTTTFKKGLLQKMFV